MPSSNFEQNRQRLIEAFYERFIEGGSFATITQARQLAAGILDEAVRPGEPLTKAVEEAIEQGMLLAAKHIVETGEERTDDIYDRLVDLYHRQPTLGTRTSSSIELQQYSTPAPLAYLAGKLAGIDPSKTVYEPTAGRGALLMLSTPANVLSNELDPKRAADLLSQGYRTTNHDATRYRPEQQVDVVISNPPFGRRKGENGTDKFLIGAADTPITTAELDQAISWKALEAMKDNGTAVLIIGSERGNDEERQKRYNSLRVRKYFFNLYRQYHVIEHFTVEGSLYNRQGGGYPVDIIAIEGRKQQPFLDPKKDIRKLPGADPPRIYSSYEQLKEILPLQSHESRIDQLPRAPTLHPQSESLGTGGARLPVPIRDTGATGDEGNSESRTVSGATGTSAEGDGARIRTGPESNMAADGEIQMLGTDQRSAVSASDDERRRNNSRYGSQRSGLDEAGRGSHLSADPTARSERSRKRRDLNSGRNQSRRVADRANPLETIHEMSLEPSQGNDSKNLSTQVPYQPKSSGTRLDSYVPQNLESPIQKALDALEAKVGNVDEFVADALNFGSVENLHKALAAEQVDGVALALKSLQDGKAALIGDDTGLGKGRQMAAAIKYAMETDRVPIFITKTPGLYADIVRDLMDIGVRDIRPFVTNSKLDIPLPNGRKLKTEKTPHQRELNAMLKEGELSSKYNMVFSTYSQVQTFQKKSPDRRQFLEQIAPQSILILDEAHEAGGTAKQWDKADALPDRAQFTRNMVQAADGVFFASATATKRPDVMDLYGTRMNIAEVTSMSGLQSTLEQGGTPLQQVATSMMAEDGQYIRRARTYAGVDVSSTVVPTAHEDADQLSSIMRSILEFDMLKKAAVADLNEEARAQAKRIGGDTAIGFAGAQSTNFSSIMWNVVDQAGLARKADAVADLAISSLEAGERPFIGLSNTMGSFIKNYAKDMNIKAGDSIDITFQDVLWRYLERSRDITIKDYSGEGYRRPMTDTELGEKAVRQYAAATKLIDHADFTNMPVSPIDWIRHRVESAGYSFGELTGREVQLNYAADGSATFEQRTTQETSKAAKIGIIAGFNSGAVDIGLGNRSASTGYSMHSSTKFENQQRRHFLIAQPERDINVFKQFLGRFHRTGQVNAPKISLIVGDTPDEKRPAAVLAKKLTTLNANTTAAVKGGVDFEGIPDYFNEIGNQIVTDIMRDDPDLSERLFNPISVSEYATEPVDNAAAKVTGCLPILPVAEQEEFYQQLDMEYQATLDRYKAMGENPLEATGINLDARTLASVEVVAEAVGVDSAFARGITAEVVDVLVQSKPKSQLEVINDVRQSLEMKPVRLVEDHDQSAADVAATALVNRLCQQTEQITERYLAEKKLQYTQQEPDPEKLQGKIDKLLERSDKQLATLSKIKRFRPGQSVRMTANNGRIFYGVISNVRKRGKALDTFGDSSVPIKENVAIPSRWEVVIAISDEQRQIALPLSKLNPQVETADSFTVTLAKHYSKGTDIYQLFDQRQMGEREVRTILKGNLLRAADTPYQDQGKLILASMSNGQMEPVMLMDKGFNPQQEMEAAPVILPNAEKVEAFIAATGGRGIVKTTDESITLKQNPAGEFFIQTGKTRKDVYLDLNLQGALGGEFTSVSDRMQAKFEPSRLEDVVSYLMKGKGKRLAAFTEQSTARELLGLTIPELKWADTVETVVGREGLPPIVDVTDLNAVRQQLTEAFNASTDEPLPDSREQAIEDETRGTEATPDEGLGAMPTETPTEAIAGIPVAAEEQAEGQPTVQQPEAHRLRFKAERQVAQFLHEAGLAQQVMGTESFHLRIENEPYLPLVVEAHTVGGDRQLYLTHYREQNGDLIHDGEMVFGIKESGHLRFQEVAVQNALTGGEMRDYDREFADIFSRNILEQGFALEAVKQQAAEVQTQENVEPATQSTQTAAVGETTDSLPQLAEAPTPGHKDVEVAQVCTPRELVEKAQKAAGYIGNTELGYTLAAVLSTQSSLTEIEIPAPLQAQMQTAIGLARNKQQSEFAAEILPMAQLLLENANRAGLTRSSSTDKGRVTAFEGQNYSVRCRENADKQELKVLCHRTSGLIYAVNGEPQKSQGLLKSDKTTFARYASMSPTQLNQAVRVKQTAVKAGLEL
ncbi:MAG: methyltransferase domain-containing protein [Phormidesmis priestleyi Ana]|uniref:Methyltransferase domain-containing protein n=1 Tax=Phormidesmis priestleyi Ana TaxID=1666911 RepID=A0A0P7ZDZ6_9CYAN|nr:MAG: methyltransferase domain-containing protein [Phormidesmis priestleyi Ana]